jgi:carbon monoxide dehydrogenase subunit G
MRTKSLILTSLLIGLGFLQMGCRRPITGEGELIKETREIESFSKLSLNVAANVSLLVTDSNSATIVAQENILEHIKFITKGNSLIIQSNRMIRTDKPIKIVITCTRPEALEINGSGKITIINSYRTQKASYTINGSGDIDAKVIAKEIKSKINGSGDLHLSGETQSHRIHINGSGDLKAGGLQANNYDININGSGNAEITVLEKLDVSIVGSGDITYSGEPAIESNITGSGKIKKYKTAN